LVVVTPKAPETPGASREQSKDHAGVANIDTGHWILNRLVFDAI
jgi:cell division protein FtsX